MNEGSIKIEEFWHWFSGIAESVAADVQNDSLLAELDRRVKELDSNLSWEIGPGSHEPWQLVISPNLDAHLRERAHEIISHAPVISGWEFHSARRPKQWDYKLSMQDSTGNLLDLDASGWSFVFLEYPDGSHEILLQGDNLPPLDDDERWQAAAMVLESILGEEALMDRIDGFELLDRLEPRFAQKQKPIQRLRETVLGP